MSGLAALWQRDGRPVDAGRFERVAAALKHRAIDGSGRWLSVDGSVALWHGQFWTTPEDVGQRQPMAQGQVAVAFDGRIDNRPELCDAFGLGPAERSSISDAELALQAYLRWGGDVIKRLKGPFVVVVWDAANRRLLGARDAIGRRSLFYRIDGAAVTIASEPGAVLGGDMSGVHLDEVFLAHYFALRPAPLGRTMYDGVRELPAGHVLHVSDDAVRLERHLPTELPPIRYRRIDDYGERFAELLGQAVARRLRAVGEPAVLMSGGLDSTSVAALAARDLAATAPGRRLSVISYVFDELTDLDEREWMAPMVARYDLDQTLVTADDAWPLCDFDAWSWNANGPDTGPFRPLNERLYAAARAKGHRVLLTGAAGDSFFVNGRASWLVDLVDDGRSTEALVELLKHVRRLGLRAVARSESARRLAARLLRREPGPERSPRWLTSFAARCVAESPADGPVPKTRRRPADTSATLVSLHQGDGIATGDGEHRAGVELRDPFADADLVAFMLSIPAYALYNQGASKLVLRKGMAQALPPALLARRRRSDISPLYWRGIAQRAEVAGTTALLDRAGAFWRRYVRPEALLGDDGALARQPHIPALLRWQCLSFEWWMIRTTLVPEIAA